MKNKIWINSIWSIILKDNSNKKVLVYALEGCPACIELKNKLDKVGVVFETVDMGGNQDIGIN